MDQSILNHLFLPHYLPSSADDDFLIQNNHQNEHMLLEYMKEYFHTFHSIDAISLPIFGILTDCIERWSLLQNPQNVSVTILQSSFNELPLGSFLPLYFHNQNAAILIEMDVNNTDQPIISSWQVLLPSAEITSSFLPHISCFPVRTYKLNNRSELISKVHCELLIDLMKHSTEYSKSNKASNKVDEIRDVPESHFVCQWWIEQFQQINIENSSNKCYQFRKKHRDHIRWNKALLPFRRSGLWMTIKVVLQTILTKHLKCDGFVVYKLLVTHFLTDFIYKRTISTDLLLHCIRKIVRRLNKVEGLVPSINSNDVIKWTKYIKEQIQIQINLIIPKLNWQKSIQEKEKINSKLFINNSNMCQHSFPHLQTYLNNQIISKRDEFLPYVNNYNHLVDINQIDSIPTYKILTIDMNYTVSIALMRIEIWIESSLEQWLNHSNVDRNGNNRFEILLRFFEEYQSEALKHYFTEEGQTDPIGYTRFILASLTIIRVMRQKLCNHSNFERLKCHSINIPNLIDLFEYLILPSRDDMNRAFHLYHYFKELNHQIYPDLLTKIDSNEAFGVHYANQSSTMNENLNKIRDQSERDKQNKIIEVNEARERYRCLIDSIMDLFCQCTDNNPSKSYQRHRCHRCQIQQQADQIEVKIFECSLPPRRRSALSVIFELQMPIEIRSYREILWQFINRPYPNPKSNFYEWLNVEPHNHKLTPYYTGPHDRQVRLVSKTKSITQSHYSSPNIATTSTEDYLFENSLLVEISPNKSMDIEDERRILTPQLNHLDYEQLQFTLNTTQFLQNEVIAQLSYRPPRLKSTQFVEFGSFRSGHHLQWWNLLILLEMESLSIGEESVAILIIHSLLQYGPLSNQWCSQSHEYLLDDCFVDEFVVRLNRYLDNCKLNWQSEIILLVLTMITMRIFNICNETKVEQLVHLAMKCRRMGEEWIDLISINIQRISSAIFSEEEKLHLKMINIGVACLLTFSTYQNRINYLLSSNEDVISLLKAATIVHDNIIFRKDQSNISHFIQNMIRFSQWTLIIIQPTLSKYLQTTDYQSLTNFVKIYWVSMKDENNIKRQWKKRKTDIYDGWYDCQYESRYVSIDCIRGTFLVDGMTIGFLPEIITSNELFVRVFGDYIFEVQSAKLSSTYITKHSYHDYRKVYYQFHFDDHTKYLTITEQHQHTDEIYQLIPHICFFNLLPDIFVSNYSHWWNVKDRILEFRPIHFKSIDFLDKKPYIYSMETGYISTTGSMTKQILVNQSSEFSQSLFNKYFIRLDDKPYVYMMRDNETTIYIHLSRLGIAFTYNANSKTITSREYSDMYIDENQWLGTLTGLKSGLILSPSFFNDERIINYSYRKLIVPFGYVHAEMISSDSDQAVTINRSSLSEEFLHHYFVFIINDRLKILQPTDSPAGWLYLALLHAMTSHPLLDDYIEMTGMERAFQLLNSAGCWSDQPFDALSVNIIGQIGAISPKVNYYPEHLTKMEKIDWNCNGIPYSMQHFGYYLLAKNLIETSEQLSFMYSSLIIPKKPEIFDKKYSNEMLLRKLYWDYRDSYNPLARLSPEMESDILRYSNSVPYQIVSRGCSRTSNYPPVQLVNDLYNNGNLNLRDYSKIKWLPLSQWVNDQNKFNTIWIGLLQMAVSIKVLKYHQRQDEIEQFDKLIDFLHYVSDKLNIKPFYLQMLKTVLHVPTVSLSDVSFPPFISYQKIEDFSIVREGINLQNDYPWSKRNQILTELNGCWCNNHEYDNRNNLVTSNEKGQINRLLKSWKNNFKLRSFLESIDHRVCSVSIEHFNKKVVYYPQQFIIEDIKNHYRLEVKQTNNLINQKLLSNANQKFNHVYSDYFNKSSLTLQTVNRQKDVINEIFPSNDNEENSLEEITDHFRNQLNQSWNKFLSDKQIQKENPSIEEIDEYLNHLRKETTSYWNELIRSITEYNEHLFQVGLIMRITPTTLIAYFQEKVDRLHLSTDQQTLLGGILVNWTLEQQLERTMYFAIHNKWDDFNNEISNVPHSNWIPSKHVLWLILELEMNITIRQIQIKVAQHMIEPNMEKTDDNKRKSIVMQMNMGEGKTSVILPMLAVSICSSSSSLIRIIVLKSLFPTNYQSLRFKLGGLLNRRIFPFTCRRDMKFDKTQIEQIGNRLRQGLYNYDVILTTAEDILSFDLLSIDRCQENQFEIGRSMLIIQQWMKEYIRDILDESDEILHVKYQLIYTMGGQQQIDGGAERWETIQSILDLVKRHAPTIANQYRNEICYKSSERKSAFPQLCLLSSQSFPLLCEKIARSWVKNRNYLHSDKKLILSFILKIHSSIKHLVERFPISHIQLFLIVRGLLSSEVLLYALKKRYRVNYGINLNSSFNRLMAVPFRAKDVPADRTEFGHLDIALILTQLSYYYSGLNDEQLLQCLTRLSEKENDPSSIYDQWILYEKRDDIPYCIKQWERVNLKDYQQRTSFIFPTFQYNMLVINYFLNHFVFPREAKQFSHKLVASAWDLSSSARSKIITGFSGTNDTQLLLPIDICQYDLPKLEKTDAIVINNLLETKNESYQSLSFDANSNEILNKITNYKEIINVILDVGALFIDQTNRNIAVNWLNLSDQNQIDYAVYFQSDTIFVCDRQFHHHRFDTSPASERIDHCVFYFDEIHTRGTDLKFSNGFKAAITLGNNLTKDRFVQACMRMRKLGNGHSLTFWSSYEVHQEIRKFKQSPDDSIELIDILRWVYANTIQSIWDGLHYWSAQSLNFQRKLAAFQQINWKNFQQSFKKNAMKEFARECLEPEITELIRTYGTPKTLQLIDEIYLTRYKQFNKHFSEEIHNAVIKRLREYGGKKKRLSQMLGEEHQRELEYELEEERQVVKSSSVRPCKPILHEELIKLSHAYEKVMNLSEYPLVFQPVVHAFTGTTFSNHCQPNCWQQNLWVSTEFQRVIQTNGESMNFSMRPPRWIVVYRNLHIIFISPFEANFLISRLRTPSHKLPSKNKSITTLRLLLPRMKPSQSIFVNTPTLIIPPLVEFPNSLLAFTIPLKWIVQLFIFNGTLYFKNIKEQTAYCHCLGLCPKPRTKIEKDFFEKGWIAIDGFVNDPEHRSLLKIAHTQFISNPLTFVKQLIEYRNNSPAPITSHVGSIIYNSLKLIQPNT